MDTKVRLIHPKLIFLLFFVFLISVMLTLPSTQSVLAQDGLTATVTQTEALPWPTMVYTPIGSVTVTVTTTVTTTATVTPINTTLAGTVIPTGTDTPKPTVTQTTTATWTAKPTITATATVTPIIQTYTVSGTLGVKGAGATVAYTGGSTTADNRGNYLFPVPSGWTGSITPFKPGYVFSPTSINITMPVTTNLPNQNFTTKQAHR